MASFGGITFNSIPMPYFVKVKGIKHRILPTVSQNLLTVGGRAGSYDYGNTIGNREIDIDIQIVTPEPNVLPAYLKILAEWLYFKDARELILGDNPSKFYMAKISGDTDITEDFVVGEGTLKFVCTDPFIYGASKFIALDSTYDGSVVEIENDGTADAESIMEFTMNQDVTAFSIISGDEVIDFGTPFTVDDSEDQIVDYRGYVLNDTLNNLSGWSTAPSITGGSVTGTFEVYGGHCFRQAEQDYGSGTAWHGASMIKSLSHSVTDFSSKFSFRLNNMSTTNIFGTIVVSANTLNIMAQPDRTSRLISKAPRGTQFTVTAAEGWWYRLSNGYYCLSDPALSVFTPNPTTSNMLGKVMFFLLDNNGLPVVELSYADPTARMSAIAVDITLINGSTRKKIGSSIISNYSNSIGFFLVERIGRVWTVGLGLNDFYNKTSVSQIVYVDWDDQFTQDINRVQIATLAWTTYPAPYMELWDVSVISEETPLQPDNGDIPVILRQGDLLRINNKTGAITKNGLPFYEFLNPASTLIKFPKGKSGLVLYPHDCFSAGSIEYVERDL